MNNYSPFKCLIPKKAFSVAEAMITLLIVSVALAAMAPFMTKKAQSNIGGNSSVPTGAILMWSGSLNKIPNGFALCDGKNSTPDLRGRFLVGYNSSDSDYNRLGNVGGEKAHKLTINEVPSHSHSGVGSSAELGWDVTNGVACLNDVNMCQGGPIRIAMGDNPTYNNYSERLTLTMSGGDNTHENRPPYYTIAYIIRQ